MRVTWTGTPEEWDAIVEFCDRGVEDWEYYSSGPGRDDYTDEDLAKGNQQAELASDAIRRHVETSYT